MALGLDEFYRFTDKGYAHNMLGVYEKLLIGTNITNMLEIGVLNGESIRMWSNIFPGAQVHGVDTTDTYSLAAEMDNVTIYFADAYSESFLERIGGEVFDFILDDGSHELQHQCFVAQRYGALLSTNGLMVIEDVASIEEAHLIQRFIPDYLKEDSYIIDRRGAPCDYPYERFEDRNEILVVIDRR